MWASTDIINRFPLWILNPNSLWKTPWFFDQDFHKCVYTLFYCVGKHTFPRVLIGDWLPSPNMELFWVARPSYDDFNMSSVLIISNQGEKFRENSLEIVKSWHGRVYCWKFHDCDIYRLWKQQLKKNNLNINLKNILIFCDNVWFLYLNFYS